MADSVTLMLLPIFSSYTQSSFPLSKESSMPQMVANIPLVINSVSCKEFRAGPE